MYQLNYIDHPLNGETFPLHEARPLVTQIFFCSWELKRDLPLHYFFISHTYFMKRNFYRSKKICTWGWFETSHLMKWQFPTSWSETFFFIQKKFLMGKWSENSHFNILCFPLHEARYFTGPKKFVLESSQPH